MPGSRGGRTGGGSLTAFQRLQEQLKWVDLVFEVRDARVPRSSCHPHSERLFGTRPRLIVFAKEDLADPRVLKEWMEALPAREDRDAVALSLKESGGKGKVVSRALALTEQRRKALTNKGLLPRPMRACVVGLPNVGKSSFINWLLGKRRTIVGNKPGVTKGAQWVRLHPQLELLDTPGILPPVSFGRQTAFKLALLNLLPENVYDLEDVARQGLALVCELYPRLLDHYGLEQFGGTAPSLEDLARARRCLGPGGSADTYRAAQLFLRDLRSGNLGRVTLDRTADGKQPDEGQQGDES